MADFIVTIKVSHTDLRFTRIVRLWSPLLYLLNQVSLRSNCGIIIKPANKLLENNHDTTSNG